MRHRLGRVISIIVVALIFVSCSGLKFGREFPSPGMTSIKNGVTTQADLVRMFGDPKQVGVKDGDQTWTWYYARQDSKEEFSKQLDVTFTPQGVVKSHSFSSSFPEDKKVH